MTDTRTPEPASWAIDDAGRTIGWVEKQVENRSYPGSWIVTIDCPYGCRWGSHQHGVRRFLQPGDEDGHRVADCGARGGYIVKRPPAS